MNDQCDNGYTALSYTNSPEIAEFLLEVGADPNLRSIRGFTAIENAQEHIERIREFAPESEQIVQYENIIEIIRNRSE